MRAYTIKHKGATIWQNLMLEQHIALSNKDIIYAGLLFFRKKDAEKYLQIFKYKEFYEVVGMTLDQSKQDNRKRK